MISPMTTTLALLLPAVHLAAAGLWLGCVCTEVVFERALASDPLRLAQLHRRVDAAVELPACLVVLLTGLAMLTLRGRAPWDAWLAAKIALGAVALAANAMCARLVWRRATCAQAGDTQGFATADRRQHRWGAVVLAGLVAALALGLRRLAG